MTAGWLYDGTNAWRHDVTVTASNTCIHVLFPDGQSLMVPVSVLTPGLDEDGRSFQRDDVEGWRLTLTNPPDTALAALLPRTRRYGGWIDRVGLWRATGVALFLSAVLVAVGYTAPNWLAPLVPMQWEKRYGDALVGDFGGHFCKGAGGQAALDRLTARLAPDGGFAIRVIDMPVVNAAALPGGHIVIFRKLIDDARSPDALAGVVAHEIEHVRKRHVMSGLIRRFGVGILLAGVGGQTGSGIDTVVGLSYGRTAEQEADEGAVARLAAAGISPLATADFFRRLPRLNDKLDAAATYLSTHPMARERERLFAASHDARQPYRPALDAADWAALRRICAG
ncbi:M48 family metallopeptidase [Sphingomonas flavalba]|uniref:M48 family metallopeptidase n=1 Tax=Sphingomonas flavalba TaxID=2559804 RepID=UPI0039E12EC5